MGTLIRTDQLQNPYKFSVNATSAQNSGNGAFALVGFNVEEYDTNNNFAVNQYTCPVAGFYQFNASIAESTTAGVRLIASIFKNGTEHKRGLDCPPVTVQRMSSVVSSLVQCAAGDVIDIRCFGGSTTALSTTAAEMWFNGYLVSTT